MFFMGYCEQVRNSSSVTTFSELRTSTVYGFVEFSFKKCFRRQISQVFCYPNVAIL